MPRIYVGMIGCTISIRFTLQKLEEMLAYKISQTLQSAAPLASESP